METKLRGRPKGPNKVLLRKRVLAGYAATYSKLIEEYEKNGGVVSFTTGAGDIKESCEAQSKLHETELQLKMYKKLAEDAKEEAENLARMIKEANSAPKDDNEFLMKLQQENSLLRSKIKELEQMYCS